MSKPENPLDKYRSHSIHYILLVANSTEGLRPFCDINEGDKNLLMTVASKKLGEEVVDGVYILVDSRRTSEFSIQNMEYSTFVGGGANPSQMLQTIASIKMSLVDPSGIGFFNYLKYLIDVKLKTDMIGLKFLLNISFIGHTFEGKTELVDGLSIPLMSSTVFSLSHFSTKGGVYDMEFLPASTMVGSKTQHPLISLSNNVNYQATDSLLGTAVQSFENFLNKKSKDLYQSIAPIEKLPGETVQESQVTANQQTQNKKNGRMVQYMITIPPEWFKFSLAASPQNIKEINFAKNNQEENKANDHHPTANLSSSNSDSVQEALIELLSLCPDITKMANLDAKKSGNVKLYKILTSITSDSEVLMVHFDVVEYNVADPAAKPKVAEGNNNVPKPEETPDGAIEFDFIFSGKNNDVLDFDIKIDNLSLALFSKPVQSVAAKSQILGTPQLKKNNDPVKRQENSTVMTVRENEIIIPQLPLSPYDSTGHVDMPNRNEKNYDEMVNNRQEFHKSLSDLCATGSIPILKIRGNPDLLRGFTVDSIPPHTKLTSSLKEYLSNSNIDRLTVWEYDVNSSENAKPAGGATIAAAHLEHRKYIDTLTNTKDSQKSKNFLCVGQYMKVNVYGPRDYPFSQEAHLDSMFRVKLFYDGWYKVQSITNRFEGANFTQEIELIATNVYGVPLATQQSSNQYNKN